MSAEPRSLSPASTAKIVAGIETHATLAHLCRVQAAGLLEREKLLHHDGQTILSASIAILRATYESEAATHCAALTQVACTLALLEADGYDVEPFHALSALAEAGPIE